jgi:hypothetical protein
VGLVQLLSLLDDDSGAANPPRFFSMEKKKHPVCKYLHTLTVGVIISCVQFSESVNMHVIELDYSTLSD